MQLHQTSADTYNISCPTEFTFAQQQLFIQQLRTALGFKPKRLVLSLTNTQYIDSAAIGLLLLATKEAQRQECQCQIAGASGYVAETLSNLKIATVKATH